MIQMPNQREQIIRYLTGRMSELEKAGFEQSWLTDDRLFTELQVVETELIDRYVQTEMSRSEQADFERNYLTTPERMQRVNFARALLTVTTSASAPSALAIQGGPKASTDSWFRKLLARLKIIRP